MRVRLIFEGGEVAMRIDAETKHEEQILHVLADAGLNHAQVTRSGNPQTGYTSGIYGKEGLRNIPQPGEKL